jgi:hypothetical protein
VVGERVPWSARLAMLALAGLGVASLAAWWPSLAGHSSSSSIFVRSTASPPRCSRSHSC